MLLFCFAISKPKINVSVLLIVTDSVLGSYTDHRIKCNDLSVFWCQYGMDLKVLRRFVGGKSTHIPPQGDF